MDRENGLRSPALASLGLAFASFGDAFLYPYLPLNYVQAGLPIAWIGVVLSINRFIRIFSNGVMVHLFAKYGLRIVLTSAVVLAIISTAGYAFASGILFWLLLRVIWGIAFSAMRIGTLGYSLQHSKPGFSLGLSRSIQEAGPMVTLLIAPLLIGSLPIKTIFLLLTLFSLPALWFALKLPNTNDRTPPLLSKRHLQIPSSFNLITFISAFVIDGILVVVLGILFLKFREHISLVAATSLAAFFLAYRRLCLVLLSPAGGWIADRLGIDRVFNFSTLTMAIGLLVLISGWIVTGALIVFTFYSISAAITPGSASRGQVHSLAAVAENATWRDMGAATGTLAGGMLITSPYLRAILFILIFILYLLLLIHAGTAQKMLKQLSLWK